MNYLNRCLFLLIIIPFVGFSQHLEKNELDSLLVIIKQQKTDDSTLCNVTNRVAWHYAKINPQKSKELAQKALSTAIENALLSEQASAYNTLGVIARNDGSFNDAVNHYLKALKIYEAQKNTEKVGTTYNNISVVHMYNELYDESKKYALLALDIFKELNNLEGEALVVNNLGIMAYYENNIEESISYFKRSLEIEEQKNNPQGIAESINNIGAIYFYNQDYENAISYFNKSLDYEKKVGNKQGMASSLSNLGEVYIEQKDYKNAEKVLLEGLSLARSVNSAHEIQNLLFNLFALYQQQKNSDKALTYHIQFSEVRDSLISAEKSMQIADMQTKYETEKKEQEIITLNNEKEIDELTIKQKNYQIILLLLTIAIISFSVFLFINRQKNKRKQEEQLAEIDKQKLRVNALIEGEEKERKRLATELHDGLGQVLSSVRINISNNDFSEKENSLALIDEAIGELRNISHNLMPSALIKLGLVPAVSEIVNKISSSTPITISFQTFGFENRLPNAIEINIYRIIQEILNNILKYADASKIDIQMIEDERMLNITIEDNGNGFDTTKLETSTGIGWKNIKSRLAMVNGDIDIDSHPKRGTTVLIDINLN